MYYLSMTNVERATVSLPSDLAAWARARAGDNVSGYMAGLIRKDKRLVELMEMFERHGYVGDKAITEAGIDAARARLHGHRARRQAAQQPAA